MGWKTAPPFPGRTTWSATPRDGFESSFWARVMGLLSAGPDLLAFETLPSLQETRAVIRVLEGLKAPPAWVSFTCSDDAHVVSGDVFTDCVELAAASDAVAAIGVNCTAPEWVETLLGKARKRTDKPLLAYPNRGGIWCGETKTWTVPESVDWTKLAHRYQAAGAQLIGGCCQTTPADIAEICGALRG